MFDLAKYAATEVDIELDMNATKKAYEKRK